MQHAIPADRHGPLGSAMTGAIEACVHCGFCLAACPTYAELGQEMDSPRGRIVLMKQALEGTLSWSAAQPHVDCCLGCLACEPACPSGVRYRDLISAFRALAEDHSRRPPVERLRRQVSSWTLPHPGRFRAALHAARWARPLRPFLPTGFQAMLDLAPAEVPPPFELPELTPAVGARRARVALLAGCAQQVLQPDIHRATIEVLTRQGVEVLVPPHQGCCGGLAWHTGDLATAQRLARRNLAAFPADVDAVLTNAAGCGSTLHEYGLMLRGSPEADRAEVFGRRAQDVSVFLAQLGLREPPPAAIQPVRIAYLDACHLAHAQGVRGQPRELLRQIPGVELVELAHSPHCCGSAGTYNLDQPALAAALGEQKARAVIASGAELLVAGNIGCLTQVEAHLRRLGSPVRCRHTFQVLRDALAKVPLANPAQPRY